MPSYFYREADNLSDRGCNKAVEVYRLTKGYPVFVGGNYSLMSGSWGGYIVHARDIITEKCGHKQKPRRGGFVSPSVHLRQLGEYA